ncbi:hypothetical protein [Panacagrimonas sp.]|uniref:hypothetical protein n=1 Tax=Panacagrimonas sp. TaxID=2480088 RepID=UPI003B528F57
MEKQASISSQKTAVACTWIFTLLTVVGWLGIANFWMPVPADAGMEATHQWFAVEHKWGILIGCTLFYIAAGFLTPSSIQFGIMLAKIEGRWPIWSLTTAVCGIFISLIVFFNACAWMVAAYRPETGADVAQSWYDWAWFAFLLGWIYLSIEMISTALVELQDQRETPMVPRWFSWFTIAGAVAIVTAAGPAFFKTGPFAYHGLLAFYMPVLVWGVYLNGNAVFMWLELSREQAARSTRVGASVSGAALASR